MPTIVTGPRGCGKTYNRDRIAAKLGCTKGVFDLEDNNMRRLKSGVLYLSNATAEEMKSRYPAARIVSYDTLGMKRPGGPQ